MLELPTLLHYLTYMHYRLQLQNYPSPTGPTTQITPGWVKFSFVTSHSDEIVGNHLHNLFWDGVRVKLRSIDKSAFG